MELGSKMEKAPKPRNRFVPFFLVVNGTQSLRKRREKCLRLHRMGDGCAREFHSMIHDGDGDDAWLQ